MNKTKYSHFVRPTTVETTTSGFISSTLDGQTAKKLYLEEVGNLQNSKPFCVVSDKIKSKEITRKRKNKVHVQLSNQELFQCVQNDDVDKLRVALDTDPDKINTVDEFGWSLLMIACQANSIDTVKELLSRGIDTAVRDKAGNSARTLVLRNKNIAIANLLLDHSRQIRINDRQTIKERQPKIACYIDKQFKKEFICEICDNRLFEDKQEHLSSTIHNINASKGKKIPTSYVIPESNRGYQIMLKVGWDKETGLGRDGTGKKYPIKTIKKNDKRGLGHKVIKNSTFNNESPKQMSHKMFYRDRDHDKRLEINFRREFY